MVMEEVELCFPHLNTSCRKTKRPHSHTVLIYIVLSFISLLTVTLNLLVIVSISHFKQLHTPTNLLLLSLAVSDFFVGLLLLFKTMLIDGCWLLGDIMCIIYHGLDYVNTSTSVRTMMLISVDRYVAVCDPLHYPRKVTLKRVGVCISLSWIFSLFFLSMIIKNNLSKQAGWVGSCTGECVIFTTFNDQVADLVITFFIPITAIMVLYTRVFVVAVTQARALRSHVGVVSVRHSAKVTAKKCEIKAARTLGLVILVFLLCVCPYFNVPVTGQDSVPSASFALIIVCLAHFNSCLNPIIYAFFYPWFRKCFRLIVTLQILKPGLRETNLR